MALTELQRAQVRMYLGYQRGYDLNPALESRMDILSSDEETLVGAVLTKLGTLDTKIDDVAGNGTLEAIRIGSIELREGDPLELYAAQGRRLIARLESLLSVAALRDYYGQGAGSSGGVIPLG